MQVKFHRLPPQRVKRPRAQSSEWVNNTPSEGIGYNTKQQREEKREQELCCWIYCVFRCFMEISYLACWSIIIAVVAKYYNSIQSANESKLQMERVIEKERATKKHTKHFLRDQLHFHSIYEPNTNAIASHHLSLTLSLPQPKIIAVK